MYLDLHLAYDSGADFAPRRKLDPYIRKSNQQLRIDVMKVSAPLKSTAADDMLVKVYRTEAGASTTQDWMLVQADVSDLQGKTVRLRLAEVDNQGCLGVTVDAFGMSAVI